MSTRHLRVVLSIVSLAWAVGCDGGTPVIPQVSAWLECEECNRGELDSLQALGQPALTVLAEVLDQGPPAERRERLEGYLDSIHGTLVDYARTHPTAGSPPSRKAYVRAFLGHYEDLYRVRAAIGLATIGGAQARDALESALEDSSRVRVTATLHYVLDSICGVKVDTLACE